MTAQTDKLREESHNLLSRTKLSFEYQEEEAVHTRLTRSFRAYKRERKAGKYARDKTLFNLPQAD